MSAGVTESMASRVALSERIVVVELLVTEATEAVVVPLRSRSETVRVPDVESVDLVFVNEAVSSFCREPTEIRGVSLAPVMVTVMS